MNSLHQLIAGDVLIFLGAIGVGAAMARDSTVLGITGTAVFILGLAVLVS